MNLIKQLTIFAYRVWPITLIVMLGIAAVVLGPQPARVADSVPDMSREAQCARDESKYIVVLSYNGSPIEKAYYRCDNNALISVSKI